MSLIARLIIGTVEMVRMPLHGQAMFLSVIERFLTQESSILFGVIDDDDAIRFTEVDVFFDDLSNARIIELSDFYIHVFYPVAD